MGIGAAIAGAAGIGAAASIGSAVIGSNAAKSAAQTQANAANESAVIQLQNENQNRATLAPFVSTGQNALNDLSGRIPALTAPFQPNLNQLAQTPGYQFTRQQGELATQNALSGTQPGGAASKSLVNYAEGLAGTTFQQQFQNYLAQNLQTYNMLSGLGSIGENAAAQTGSLANASTNSVSNLLTGGASASAAGTIGSANSILGGLNSGSNALTNAIGLSAVTGALGGSGSPFSGVTGGAGPLSVQTV